MVVKVGINGFGRIGRVIFRTCAKKTDIQISAINDPAIEIEYIGYLIKFDSTHGKFDADIKLTSDNEIKINGNSIKIFHQKTPSAIPWEQAEVQIVVEASGMFTSLKKASGHLASESVERVIVTAPSSDVPMIILGVNDYKLKPDLKVISCTSSTLYCLAPIVKVLEDNYGVSEGFITSIHAMTPSLKPLDGLCIKGKHWRDHRSIHQNIIPATTGACKALGKIIPQVKDKLSGLAFRVPIVNVSVLDLTIRLRKDTSIDDIVRNVEKVKESSNHKIIQVSKEQNVSSDFIGDEHSCTLDVNSSLQLKPNFIKLICWYENEYSYACRVLDTILCIKQYDEYTVAKTPNRTIDNSMQLYFRSGFSTAETDLERYPLSFTPKLFRSSSNGTAIEKKSSNMDKPFSSHNLIITSNSNISQKNHLDIIAMPASKKTDSNVHDKITLIQNDIAKNKIKIGLSVCEEAHERLKDANREFSKMVNLTEDLLKKSQNHTFGAVASTTTTFVEFLKLSTVTKDKYKIKLTNSSNNCNLKLEVPDDLKIESSSTIVENRRDGITENIELQDEDKNGDKNVTVIIEPNAYPKQKGNKRDGEQKQFNNGLIVKDNDKKVSRLHNDDINTCSAKINHLIDIISKNIDKRHLLNNNQNTIKENTGKEINVNGIDIVSNYKNEIISVKENDNFQVSDYEPLKAVNKENAVTSKLNDTTEIDLSKLENKEENLIEHNIVLLENSGSEIVITDKENCREIVETPKQNLDDIKHDGLDGSIVVVSEGSFSCCSPVYTETTISRDEINYIKQDIYDKLDSASGTDSENSFQIHERKSQVIDLSDFNYSDEDLGRLDKICRIIEISDEMSNKLFSPLDGEIDFNKKWSFKDLCDKIKLDEFCSDVLGKSAA